MLFCPETATCWSAGCGADRNSPACLHTRPLIHVCLAAGNSARRTGHRQKALSRSAGRRLGPSAALGIEPVEIALQPGSRPILSGGGGGIFFFWYDIPAVSVVCLLLKTLACRCLTEGFANQLRHTTDADFLPVKAARNHQVLGRAL